MTSFTIIGTGNMGTAIGGLLADGGSTVTYISHDEVGSTPMDGDVVFALSNGKVALPEGPQRAMWLAQLGSAAADCMARAIARSVFEAAAAN